MRKEIRSEFSTDDEKTLLAHERTSLAHERTLMAWVRTSISLISFGFTIYKFFDFAQNANPAAAHKLISPREYAMMMIGLGLGSLVFALIQHERYVVEMRKQRVTPRSAVSVVAAMVSLMGLFTLVVVIFHQ